MGVLDEDSSSVDNVFSIPRKHCILQNRWGNSSVDNVFSIPRKHKLVIFTSFFSSVDNVFSIPRKLQPIEDALQSVQ